MLLAVLSRMRDTARRIDDLRDLGFRSSAKSVWGIGSSWESSKKVSCGLRSSMEKTRFAFQVSAIGLEAVTDGLKGKDGTARLPSSDAIDAFNASSKNVKLWLGGFGAGWVEEVLSLDRAFRLCNARSATSGMTLRWARRVCSS